MSGINGLSLFDGMSGFQQALERQNIKVNNYYASEIDKFAIQVTMANYPNTIQLGSVKDIKGSDLPKIDILCGGSPCQSFSFAGKRKGMATKDEIEIYSLEHYLELKEQGFEFEGQSYLFWEYVRILHEVKPTYWILENVEMGEKWEKVLSKALGVNAIHINSALVSAQNRKRIYFTNIGLEPGGLFGDLVSIIKQPKDKGILLKDILEKEVDEKYFLSEKALTGLIETKFHQDSKVYDSDEKMQCLRVGGNIPPIKIDKQGNVKDNQDKASCFTAGGHSGGNHSDMDLLVVELTEVRTEEAKQIRKETGTNPKRAKELVERTDNKIGALLTSQTKDNLVAIMLGRSASWGMPENGGGKSYTLCKEQPHGIKSNSRIRRLTPLECERLQTVKDQFTNQVSDSQRYKMLGNGFTIDVIAHILSYCKF